MNHLRTSLLLALGLVTAMPVVADTGVTVGVDPGGNATTVTVAAEPSAPQTSPPRPFTLDAAIKSSHEPTLLDVLGRYRHESRFHLLGPDVLAYATKQLSLSGTSAFTRWSAVLYDNSGYPYFSKGLNSTMDINASAFGLDSKNGVYQYYTLDPSNKLTFASFGSMPTQPRRTSGKAFYKGHLYGFLFEKGTVNQTHEAYGNLEVSVTYNGRFPWFIAYVKGVDYKPVDIKTARLDVNKPRVGFKHLPGWFHFSSNYYSDGVQGYYHGDMQCVFFCVRPENYRSKWQAMYAGTGQNGRDREFVHGSFEMENFILNGLLFDWVGFLYADLYTPFGDVARGYGPERYSPRQAMTVHLVGEKFRAQGLRFATLARDARVSVVKAAGTIAAIDTPSADAVQLHVDYSSGSPVERWADVRLQHSTSNENYLSSVGGTAAKPTGGGVGVYQGNAIGVYSAVVSVGNQGISTVSDTFVSNARLRVRLNTTSPTLVGWVGYRIEVDNAESITGKLDFEGGKWNNDTSVFSDGKLTCSGDCSITNTVDVAWSAMLMNFGMNTTTINQPDGLVGKYGALDVRHYNREKNILAEFALHGVFALNNRSIAMRGARPTVGTYFPQDPVVMVTGANGKYHRGFLPESLNGGSWNSSSVYSNLSPRVTRGPHGNFLHDGNTVFLSTPLWDWRSNDYGTCYCTMFFSGVVYGKNGSDDQTTLSSSWQHRTNSTDKKYGWIAGVYSQDVLAEFWDRYGAINMGIFVDGTHPTVSLPVTGGATYLGDATSYAIPSASTVATDMIKVNGDIKLDVVWKVNSPKISGLLVLDGNYSGSHKATFAVSLTEGSWSAADKRFSAGSVTCAGACKFASSTKGSWQGLFVETKDGEDIPGAFAGAFAISSVTVVNQVQLGGLDGTWDFFGWFGADTNISRQFLDLPRQIVNIAESNGFGAIYKNATSGQRAAAVSVAGIAKEGHHNDFHGSLFLNALNVTILTGFWLDNQENPAAIGVINDARDIWDLSIPVEGIATYSGKAAAFYAQDNGRNGGTVTGNVSLQMDFKRDQVDAAGKMSLDFNGADVTLDMAGQFKKSSVTDGTLTCASGCTLNNGKWGGEFVDFNESRANNTPPEGIIAAFGLEELSIAGVPFDALGVITAVKK